MKELLHGGRVFYAESGATRIADVLLSDGRIEAVGPRLSADSSKRTDVSGMTVMPGLINLHAHLLNRRTWGPPVQQRKLDDPFLVMRGVRAALASLKQGITTVRDIGGVHHLSIYLKRAIAADMFPGPRVLAAGAPISITGGHAWTISTEADGPVGMRRAVRLTIKAGADWIKLLSTNDPVPRQANGEYSHPEFLADEYNAAVEAAHMWGRRVTAHTMGSTSLEWAIDSGVDSIEHGIYLTETQAARMASRKIGLIPTLSGYHQNTLPDWGRGAEAQVKLLVQPSHRDSIKRAIAAGVRIGVGTDTIGDYHQELEMLVECGMSVGDALRAATIESARILGWSDRIGSIEAGKIADLVVVRGDPASDLSTLTAVEFVYQSGKARTPDEIVLPTRDETKDWTSLQLLS